MSIRLTASIAVLSVIATSTAYAATAQEMAFSRWKVQDKCIADSVKAHPNRNVASQRKRDKDVDTCLASHNLPPRAHLAPPEDSDNTPKPD